LNGSFQLSKKDRQLSAIDIMILPMPTRGQQERSPKNEIETINTIATTGLKPDVTYIIDVPVEIGLERLHNGTKAEDIDRLESEDVDFHRRVRAGYLELAEKEPERVIVIDGTKSIKEIHQDIMKI